MSEDDSKFDHFFSNDFHDEAWGMNFSNSLNSSSELYQSIGFSLETDENGTMLQNVDNAELSEYDFSQTDVDEAVIDEDELKSSSDESTNEVQKIDWDLLQAEFSELKDNLAISTGIATKRRRRRKRHGTVGRPKGKREYRKAIIPKETAEKLGTANILYATSKYREAIDLLHEIIASDPSLPSPWLTLGEVYEDIGSFEKALQIFLVAAHITKYDADLWRRTAEMSRSQGLNEQAISCYSQALNCDPDDLETIWKRLALYQEEKQTEKIKTSFCQILKREPNNLLVLRELFILVTDYESIKKIQPCIDNAMEYHLKQCESNSDFNYHDVNVITTFTIVQGDYIKALRRIYRAYQILTDTADDEEWLEETIALGDISSCCFSLRSESDMDFPIELKVKLGILFILLGMPNEGKQFFNYLYSLPTSEYKDLYLEARSLLVLKEQHPFALELIEEFEKRSDFTYNTEFYITKAESHYKLGNHSTALEILLKAESNDPLNPLPKSALATIYKDLGQDILALSYIAQVRNLKTSQIVTARFQTVISNIEKEKEKEKEKHEDNLKDINKVEVPKESNSLTFPERSFSSQILLPLVETLLNDKGYFTKLVINDSTSPVRRMFLKLGLLIAEKNKGDKSVLKQYFVIAFELYREFLRHKGVDYSKKLIPNNHEELDEEIPGFSLDIHTVLADHSEQLVESLKKTIGQVCLRHWFMLFIDMGLTLSTNGRAKHAQQVLYNIEKASPFKSLQPIRIFVCLLSQGISQHLGEHGVVCNISRYMFSEFYPKFLSDPVAIYSAGLTPGLAQLEAFALQVNGKFISRVIPLFENQPSPSSTMLTSALLVSGCIMVCTRSCTLAVGAFSRALDIFPNHPSINLNLGIAYLRCALQRNSINRHLQILQAFTCLMKYASACRFSQEARYNLGRAFHRLNLFNLAVPHYEAALALSDAPQCMGNSPNPDYVHPSKDLKFEAAYNLSLIYHYSGSPGLADMYIQKYCVI